MSRAIRAQSPQLRALGSDIRILAVFLDAIMAYGWYCIEVQGRVDTALLAEGNEAEGWNLDSAERTMRGWGARDQYGIYSAAGLTRRQAEVAYLHFDRQLDSPEIGELIGCDAITARVHLHNARERLRRLAA